MKKEKLNYFDEFIKATEISIECSNLLSSIFENFNPVEIKTNIEQMHKLEHRGDMEKHNVTSFLMKDFLPPIEREDIIQLLHRLDNLTDNIEEILIKIDIFGVGSLRSEVHELIKLLLTLTNKTHELVLLFKNFKKNNTIKNCIIEINHLEEIGDELYAKYMRALYKTSNDVKEIIVWTEIFNCFESCFDNCEQIADTVEAVILKNS